VALRWSVALVLAGCRFHFDDVVATPIELACNVPVHVLPATASNPHLAVTGTVDSIEVVWLDDAQLLAIGDLHLITVSEVAASAVLPDQPIAGPWDAVSIASNAGTLMMVGAMATPSGSMAELRDSPRGTATVPPIPFPGRITGALGASWSVGGGKYALAGLDETMARTVVVGVDATGASSAAVDLGPIDAAVGVIDLGSELATLHVTQGNSCEIKSIDATVMNHTSSVAWGTSGKCAQPAGAHSPGRTDLLLVHRDLATTAVTYAIAQLAGTTFTIPGELSLRMPASEPRAIGVADGYWVSYETAGALEAAHLDLTGAPGRVVPLGPIASPNAHGVTLVSGEPYAAWVGDGLELVHLCP
jgi:hypothetical protein